MFCVNHCWINMNFSKCVDFAFQLENYHNFESYQKMLTTLGFCYLNHKLQLCFVCHAHYAPFACDKRRLTILKFEKYFELILKFSNSIFLKLWVGLSPHSCICYNVMNTFECRHTPTSHQNKVNLGHKHSQTTWSKHMGNWN